MLTGGGRQLATITKKSYKKSFKTIDEQIELLENRGMLFRDKRKAKYYLINLNYYRLSGYWLPYKKSDDVFEENLYFEDIINLYRFDSELKLLFYKAIENIEISVRTKFAYYMARKHGPHPIKKTNFNDNEKFTGSYKKLKSEITRKNQHMFIEHYTNNYRESLPPIWVCVEVMTFGLLSQFIKNIKDIDIKKEIAKCYKIDISVLDALLYHLSTLRNDIAHHSRIYNKSFKITPKIPNFLKSKSNQNAIGYLYNTIIICDHILKQINGKSSFEKDVSKLIKRYNIDKIKMGYHREI